VPDLLAAVGLCALLLSGCSGGAWSALPSAAADRVAADRAGSPKIAPVPALRLSQSSVSSAALNEYQQGWLTQSIVNLQLEPMPPNFPGPSGIGHYSIKTQVASSTSCTNVFANVTSQGISQVHAGDFQLDMTSGYWHMTSATPCATTLTVYLQTAHGLTAVSNPVTLQSTFSAPAGDAFGQSPESAQNYLPVMDLGSAQATLWPTYPGADAVIALAFFLATAPPGFPGPASGTGHYVLKTQVTQSPGCTNVFGTIAFQHIFGFFALGKNLDGTPRYTFSAGLRTGTFTLPEEFGANAPAPTVCSTSAALFVARGASFVQVSNYTPLPFAIQNHGDGWVLSSEP